MKVYEYNSDDFTFKCETIVDENPFKKGEYLKPLNSTEISPPSMKDDEVAIFNSENKEWLVVINKTKVRFWLPDGSEKFLSNMNEEFPENALFTEPDLRTLEEALSEAIDLVKSRHARVLADLSGNATVEERDTWPLQKEWSVKYLTSQGEHEEALLLGLMTEAEVTALGENAAQVMAEKIIAKSAAMDLLTSKAGGLKRTAEEALNSATDKTQIPTILESLEQQMTQAIAEFTTAIGGE